MDSAWAKFTGVLRLSFSARDLARTRFAVSPLWEVVASVLVLRHPQSHSLHQPWARRVAPLLAGGDWAPLLDLVPDRGVPGFVAPPPTTSAPDLEVELAVLRATPAERVRAEVAALPGTPSLVALRADPAAGLARLTEVVAAYWDLAIAPFWPRMRALVEADVLHRARLLAEGGAGRLLNDLDPAVRWNDDELAVAHRTVSASLRLRGDGLLLVPSVFAWPRVFSLVAPPWQPTLRYPPRGVGALWERRERSAPRALGAVLGRSRARLLTELDSPASTTELARRTGLTAGAVSQHLGALRAAGFVNAYRAGRFVHYARTDVAESLLAAQDSDQS